MIKNNKSLDSQFLIRVLKNQVTDEERELFNEWLKSKDENKEEFGQIALLWEKTANLPAPLSPDLDEEWQKFQLKTIEHDKVFSIKKSRLTKIDEKYLNNKERKYFSTYFKKYVVLMRVAALVLISVLVYWVLKNSQKVDEFIKADSPKFYEFITQKGEKATIPLSDGTIVYLNADSKLTYPQYFSEKTRFLKLDGEGYFSVKPDSNRPFIVQTGDRFTVVKGTEFNIKFRNNRLLVVVTKGKVVLFNQDSSKFVDLEKGELSIATKDGFTSPQKVDTKLYIAWRENKLSFVQTPLSEILEELERFYNIDAFCKNKKILSRTLTGYFDSNSLDEILKKLSLALDFKFQRKGRQIIIF